MTGQEALQAAAEKFGDALFAWFMEGEGGQVKPAGLFAAAEQGYPYKPRHTPRRPRKVRR